MKKIIDLAKNIGRYSLLAGALAAGTFGGCGTAEKRFPPPLIEPISNKTVEEGQQFTLDLNNYVFGPNRRFTIELVSGPGRIDQNIYYYDDPVDQDHIDNFYMIGLSVKDDYGNENGFGFFLTQKDINRPPIIQNIPDQTVEEDEWDFYSNLDDYISDPDGDAVILQHVSGPGGISGKRFFYQHWQRDNSDEHMIGFKAKDGYGGEAEGSFKLIQTSIHSIVTDNSGNENKISHTKMNRTKYITLKKGEIFYLLDLSKADRLVRINRNEVEVFLRNEERMTGVWASHDETRNFYRDENNHLEATFVEGVCNSEPYKKYADDIKEIAFIEPANKGAVQQKNKSQQTKRPKRVELKDGTAFETDKGHIVDYCGHHWSSYTHTRRFDDFEDLNEIIFTGNFSPPDSQCREIILKRKDGREEKKSVEMASESYNGVCNNSPRFGYFDKMYIDQDYGAVLVPLDIVKKIILLEGDKNGSD